jgi:hypothetical protein
MNRALFVAILLLPAPLAARAQDAAVYALVEDGVVIRTRSRPKGGFVLAPGEVVVGYTFAGGQWTPPPASPLDTGKEDPGDVEERQATKPARLKVAERRVVSFLRDEGAISAEDKSPTVDQLLAAFSAWSAMSGNSGDAKMTRYERLMRPVRLLGGTDADVYDHPKE